MHAAYELAPVIADIISAHCPRTTARERFLRACLSERWDEAKSMVEGMVAEPWHLNGHQETRLRQFLELMASDRWMSACSAAPSDRHWSFGGCRA